MKYSKKTLVVTSFVMLVLIIAIGISTGNVNPSKMRGKSESTAAKKAVTLRIAWWGGDARHDYTKKVVELYEKRNEHVTIDVEEYASYDDYWKIMAPQAAAGELPDLIQIDTSYYAQYAGKQLLANLYPYFNNEIDITNISENVLNAGIYNHGNYGMTLGINVLGFQYDPAILNKIGLSDLPNQWTWEDYEKLAIKAQKAGIYFDDGMRPEIFFAYYLRTKGETLYNAAGTALGYKDDSLFVDFFGRLIRLVHLKATPSAEEKARIKGFSDNNLSEGKQIGIWQWSNQYVAMQQAVDRPMAIAPMVGPNLNKGLFLKSSMFFSIAESSKVKSEAAKFIDFWINDIEANKLILGERGVPVSTVVQESIKPWLSAAQQQVVDYVSWAEQNSSPGDPVDPVGSAEIIDKLRWLWEQMEYEQISIEEAAQIFRIEANAILSLNNINND